MKAYPYRVRCIEAYTKHIHADKMIDHNGKELCDVPAYTFDYVVGQTSGFRRKADRDAFLKANPGKWVAL